MKGQWVGIMMRDVDGRLRGWEFIDPDSVRYEGESFLDIFNGNMTQGRFTFTVTGMAARMARVPTPPVWEPQLEIEETTYGLSLPAGPDNTIDAEVLDDC